VRFRRAAGCQACSRTGYRGRIALQELLLVEEEIERAIIAHSSNDDIQHLALEQGMVPLRHDGLRKAALGITSLEEILRVVYECRPPVPNRMVRAARRGARRHRPYPR